MGSSVQAFSVPELWKAVSRREHDRVRELLAGGVDPDSPLPLTSKPTDAPRIRPLHVVAGQGDLCGAGILLDAGAEVDGTFQRYTPLLCALQNREHDVAELLESRGARATFFVACARGDVPAVDEGLGRDPALAPAADELGRTPLHVAAYALQPQIVDRLLGCGAAPDATDPRGVTPLLSAADSRHDDPSAQLKIMEALVRAGADVRAVNEDGVTALHRAVRARSVSAVAFLIDAGADVNARDRGRGSTPLRRAVNNTGAGGTAGRIDAALQIAEMLLRHGASANDRDKQGRSILQAARGQAMKALLTEHGARE
jgi:ankyrin repeat protein